MVDPTYNRLGTTSFITGLSGTNFSNLVKAEYQKDIASAAPAQRRLNDYSQKLARYKQMVTLIKDVQTASRSLSNSSFSSKSVSLTSSTSADPKTIAKITVADKAPLGKMSLKVLQTASAHKIASKNFTSDTTALNLSGKFTLKAGSGTGVDITLSATMSLNDVAQAINAKASQSGVRASVLKVSDGNYRLVLSADKTNQAISLTNKNGGTLAQTLGLLNASNQVVSELSPSRSAKIELNGLMIERDTNKFSDVLPGVEIDALRADPANTLKAEVTNNLKTVKDQIKKFVEVYNKYRQFALSQQATVEGGGAAQGAHLFGDSLLRNVTETLYKELSSTVEHNGQSFSLRAFGLSFEKDNTLKLDETKLDKALNENFEAAKSFFAFDALSSSGNFRMIKHDGKYPNQSFTLNARVDGDGKLLSADINGNSSLVKVVDGTIVGEKGTAYEGMTFAFAGKTNSSTTISIRQGIADRLQNALKQWSGSSDAVLEKQIEALDKQVLTSRQEITDITKRAEARRKELITRYAKIEQKIAAAKLMTRQLEAFAKARNSG